MRTVVLTQRGSEFGSRVVAAMAAAGLPPTAVVAARQSPSVAWALLRSVRRHTGLVDAAAFALRRLLRAVGSAGRLWRSAENAGSQILASSGTNSARTISLLSGLAPDVLVLAQAGIVRDAVLAIPRLGTLNGHPGVLPRYRGVDCAGWALVRGEPGEIGASVHWVDGGIDTGPIIAVRRFEPRDPTSFRVLETALDELATALLVETLSRLAVGEVLPGTPQRRGTGMQYFKMPRRLEAVAARRLAEVSGRHRPAPAKPVALEIGHPAPPRLRVAIDRELLDRCGPEVCWTWRTLLSVIGFAWEFVAADGGRCDIAYVSTDPPPGARLFVRCDAAAWRRVVASGPAGGDEARLLVAELLRMADHPATPWLAENGAAASDRDLILMAFSAAAGIAERGVPRNRHGHLDLSAYPSLSAAALRAPVTALVHRMTGILRELGAPDPVARWPGRATMAVCVTHDVDYPEAVRWIEPARAWLRVGRGGFRLALQVASGRKTHWHIPSWAAADEARGIRSAFFFCARRGHLAGHAAGSPDPIYDITSSRFRELIRSLCDRGFEIGLHASHGAFDNAARLAVERTLLEDVSGRPVTGCRHHFWHLDPELPERTLLLQDKAGLRYDASLANERHLGFRRGLCIPYHPFHPAHRIELGVLELPTAWMDSQLFLHRAANPGDPLRRLDALLETVASQNGCLLVDVHDYVYDDDLFPGWRTALEHLLDSVEASGAAWFATPRELSEHWTARYRALAATSSAPRAADGVPA